MMAKGGVNILNHVILVGRLCEEPKIVEQENEQARMVVTLAVSRTFKNPEGLYETDFIRCILWNGIAKKTKEYCMKGDMVCVRGRLQVRNYDTENNQKKYVTEVIVESLAFVTSVNKEKDKND